jgi:hypothetical protein
MDAPSAAPRHIPLQRSAARGGATWPRRTVSHTSRIDLGFPRGDDEPNVVSLRAALVPLLLAACTSTGATSRSDGPNCGPGTVLVNGVCQIPEGPAVMIENGDTPQSATTHWTGKVGGYTYNLAFYGDHSGIFWAPNTTCGYDCPIACPAARPTLCGDLCVDLTSAAVACGSCGQSCGSGRICVSSTCVTPDGGPSGEPGTGCTIANAGGAGLFSWSSLASGGILSGRTDGKPFKNLTNISGGVDGGNFRATVDGSAAVTFTLASGPACK